MTARIDDPASGFHHHPDGTFRKRLSTDRARAEVRGWRSICDHLPVAALLGSITHPCDEHTLIYDDVFADGRCTHLLADLILDADHDPHRAPAVAELIDAVCDGWVQAVTVTGRLAPVGTCQPGLYATRLAPGGRLDAWYGHMTPLVVDDGARVLKLDVPTLIARLREDLAADTRCATLTSQGDPTEPNIASALCWLDYEHAGRNALAGEAAVLLWYLLAMGGWLVPRYKPLTYARTLRGGRSGPMPPAVTHARVQGDLVEVTARLRAGAGRRAAIAALVARLHGDVGVLLGRPGNPMSALAPWLAVRILGVLPLTAMTDQDIAVCLLKLAELDAGACLADFTTTEQP